MIFLQRSVVCDPIMHFIDNQTLHNPVLGPNNQFSCIETIPDSVMWAQSPVLLWCILTALYCTFYVAKLSKLKPKTFFSISTCFWLFLGLSSSVYLCQLYLILLSSSLTLFSMVIKGVPVNMSGFAFCIFLSLLDLST